VVDHLKLEVKVLIQKKKENKKIEKKLAKLYKV
jgi:hypothetical protein